MEKGNLVVGRWYVDPSLTLWGHRLNQRFKLLKVNEQTVEIEDEFGEHQRVSRIGWETDMVPDRQPLTRAK